MRGARPIAIAGLARDLADLSPISSRAKPSIEPSICNGPISGGGFRAALGDEIAEALDAQLVIVLIWRTAGLSAADCSGPMSFWRRPLGATRDAAWRISAIAKLARKLGRSGTELKADMAPAQEESQGFYRKPPLFPSSKGIKLA
jgi:hypothetical protein